MRGLTKYEVLELVTEVCCKCGCLFAFSYYLQRKLRDNHKDFYCPNGHAQHYTGPTEVDRMRQERDRLKQQMAERDDMELALRTELAKAEKERRRIVRRANAGLCLDCNRSFANVTRHRATKHKIVCEAANV